MKARTCPLILLIVLNKVFGTLNTFCSLFFIYLYVIVKEIMATKSMLIFICFILGPYIVTLVQKYK